MTLLITLRSPVLGYCAANEAFFVVEHAVEVPDHHCCHHEDEAPVEIPCEEHHEFVSLDTGDYQWSPLADLSAPALIFIAPSAGLPAPSVILPPAPLSAIPPANLPPPDIPIFRRDAALRL